MPSKHVERLLQRCRELNLKLRTAESCTAGAVAAEIASVSGASDVLDRGWITYSNQAKMDELGVSSSLLEKYGAVSEPVVKAMAIGGAGSDEHCICIAISGIAGPDGGTDEKPVGTVWMAVSYPEQGIQTKKFLFDGERAQIQAQAVDAAISFLLHVLKT
ncbi:MAG: CinA family protein [Mariprofundaceae bacterium]|nr:CinA family protein [Mariprofundaceae bacterium]